MAALETKLLWIAPQRVGSTVFLQSMRGDVTYLKGPFRNKPKPSSPIATHPQALSFRHDNPGHALDLLCADHPGACLAKIEYQAFFGQNWEDAPWRGKLFDMLGDPDLFILHAYRPDLFARYASGVYARETRVIQRNPGDPAPNQQVTLSAKLAINNIKRIIDQTRQINGKVAPDRCLFLSYDDIISKAAYQQVNDRTGLKLDTNPDFIFSKVIRDKSTQFTNYDDTRAEVADALGNDVFQFDPRRISRRSQPA